jgi:predicted Zn-dependent protease
MKIAAIVAVALVSLPFARDADACGMSIRMAPVQQEKPSAVQEVAHAEQVLDGGQNVVAAKAVLKAFPRLRDSAVGTDPLETRAVRVFALAVARSNGTINEASLGVSTKTEWAPAGNLAWAIQSLREIDQKRPNDPAVQADLGEALSKVPHGQEEALTILQRLAGKDLMGSPHAYAALAKLRTAHGDAPGAEAALKRCEEMARGQGICKPAPAPAPAPKPAKPAVAAFAKA